VWQNRDSKVVRNARRKATSLERYGVEDATQTLEVKKRRRATNLERYGSENVFSKESSIFDKVQESLEGKRVVLKGPDNPFAWESTKQKIKDTMQKKYGVENPQQSQEVRDKTHQTNLERYGVEEILASPSIREQIKNTCEEQYGGPAPSCSPEVQEKQKQTNLKRYGVPWTSMDVEVRKKQLEAMEEKWGSHFFASDEGKTAIRQVMKERYGVEFPGAIEGHWEKATTTFLERYGVEHPLQLEVFNEKRFSTCLKKYGTPFPGRTLKGPNLFEAAIWKLIPDFLFVGDGQFWKWVPSLKSFKNPDFILPGPDPKHPKRGVTKVVEAFGDYWHSRMFTGKANFDHEQELIDAYAGIGISCLIIWESEVKTDPDGVKERLQGFLGR